MKIVLLSGLVPALLGGCASTPLSDPLPYQQPSDEAVGIRNTGEGNALGDYNRRQPVSPQDWRQLNDGQGPDRAGGA